MHRMPRVLLLLVVLGALAVGAFLALGRDGAHANPDPTITVNSTADTNSRDTVMTLREAILLVTGDDANLHMPGLTPAECGQISTASYDSILGCFSFDPPDAASADTIVFDPSVFPPGSPATIALSSVLPGLTSDSDTVDGSSAGVIVDGAGSSDCFFINSDGNAIKGLWIFNCNSGVQVNGGQNNTIGGSTAAERNVISGNGQGVFIAGSGNTVKGNYIGTNAAGTAAMPNQTGVYLSGGGQNTVGGSSAADRNVISGNSTGVLVLLGPNDTVKGNYIGTDAAGTAPLPNGTGVDVRGQDSTIGGTTTGDGNLIAFNTGDGVHVDGSGGGAGTGNTIRGNSIHSNGGKGIETREGGNMELAPPVITGFGSVMGTACPNCTIDVYSDHEDEGRIYEGSTTADNGGDWTFDGSPEGPNVTATATDAADNTSEFSTPVEVPEATPTPSPTPTPTPTATPSATSTPAGPTRTVQWDPGWNNATWSGASTPEEVFACAAGKYAAAYRYVAGGGWSATSPTGRTSPT